MKIKAFIVVRLNGIPDSLQDIYEDKMSANIKRKHLESYELRKYKIVPCEVIIKK
jgi:hypothetical protein